MRITNTKIANASKNRLIPGRYLNQTITIADLQNNDYFTDYNRSNFILYLLIMYKS